MNYSNPEKLSQPLSEKTRRLIFISAAALMILVAFLRCYAVSHDLKWFYDGDFYRDISYVQGILYGDYGKDPSYVGEFLWYNPLLTLVEAGLVKMTGLPINIVLIRAGTFINLLSPICFFSMLMILFRKKVALAGLLSYLFLASGNIPFFYTATYSPWIYPGSFIQFAFYLNIIFCYFAYSTQKYYWFAILGAGIGLGFLGHTAPTVIIILMLAVMQGQKIREAILSKEYPQLKRYIYQGILVFIPFVIVSFPYLYYIIGKYHAHIVNRKPFEYVDTIFIWRNFGDMIRANASISFLVAMVGFGWFYKKFEQPLIRKIIFTWLWVSVIMFFYTTLVGSVDEHLHIKLPGTVPSYHYFYYLKVLQSVFFGFGFVFLLKRPIQWAANRLNGQPSKDRSWISPALFILCAGLYLLVYYPIYKDRLDFGYIRETSLTVGKQTDKIDAYHYIVANIPADKVFLCEQEASLFPVLPTARKMVSIGITFSNPFVDFNERENDRDSMLAFLKNGQPETTRALFKKYGVDYVILENRKLTEYKQLVLVNAELQYRNFRYSLFRVSH
jgi:hypothetical protein